jgi:hypothetical protein
MRTATAIPDRLLILCSLTIVATLSSPARLSGSLSPVQLIPVSGSISSQVLADVHGDGRADVLVSWWRQDQVLGVIGSIDLASSLPDFEFSSLSTLASGNWIPTSLVFSDLTADLTPDVVVAINKGPLGGGILVVPGTGNGTFGSATELATGAYLPTIIDVGDVTADGQPDLVAWSLSTAGVSVIPGVPGGFGARFTVAPATYFRGFLLADADGDGNTDILCYSGHGMVFLYSEDTGAFTVSSPMSFGDSVVAARVADTDDDGLPDIVGITYYGGQLLIGRGLGNRQFAVSSGVTIGRWSDIQLVDMNQDDVSDLVLSNPEEAGTCIVSADGVGPVRKLHVGGGPPSLGDVDGDGDNDASFLRPGGLMVMSGPGDGRLYPLDEIATIGPIEALACADMDRDGFSDLLTTSIPYDPFTGYGGLLSIANGQAGGWQQASSVAAGRYPRAIAIADFNKDGWNDCVLANRYSNSLSMFQFGPLGPTRSDHLADLEPGDLKVADLDEDGNSDLLSAHPSLGAFTWMQGDGNGTLTRAQSWTASEVDRLVVRDDDGDGHTDVFALGREGAECVYFRGLGDGNLQRVRSMRAYGRVDIGNMDEDRESEVVAAYSDSVYVFDFGVPFEESMWGGKTRMGSGASITVADIDVDGHDDVLVAQRNGGLIEVLFGDGQGSLGTSKMLIFGGYSSRRPIVADINDDGFADIVRGDGDKVLALMGSASEVVAVQSPTARKPASSLLVSPNPSRGSVSFRVEFGVHRFDIFDISGRMIRSESLSDSKRAAAWKWDGADHLGRRVPTGVYIVRAVGSEAVLLSRFVVTR